MLQIKSDEVWTVEIIYLWLNYGTRWEFHKIEFRKREQFRLETNIVERGRVFFLIQFLGGTVKFWAHELWFCTKLHGDIFWWAKNKTKFTVMVIRLEFRFFSEIFWSPAGDAIFRHSVFFFVKSYVIVYKYHSILKVYLQSNIIVYF